MRFTREQLSAINADNPELLVSAAAGSGKTAVLVERILRLITQKGLSIDRMLVVTFTRAAAAELRERLETRLRDAAGDDPSLLRQCELASSAQISTIHGYCTRVLREHFQHCELDPQFGICEPATRARLFDECLEETLDEIYALAEANDDLRALTAKFTERELTGMFASLYDFLLSRPDPLKWLWECANVEWSEETIDATPMAAVLAREARLALDGARALHADARALSREDGFPDKLNTTLRQDEQTLATVSDALDAGLGALMALLGSLRFNVIARVKPQTDAEERMLAEFKDYRDRYKGLLAELKELLPADLPQAVSDMRAMRPATRGLYEMTRLFDEKFMARKRELAEVDFADLEHMTLAVLSDERLREVEQARFDAVFVDEYQDVSAIQEAILNGLKRTSGKPQYYFYVGDVKQSIYRFRLAEPKLFLDKQRAFSADENARQRLIVLNRNFRSRCAVLSGVNRVFSHVMDSRVTEIDYDEDARLIAGEQSVGDPRTELRLLDSAGLKPAQRVVAEATAIARDILAHVGEPVYDAKGEVCGTLRYRDIAILSPVSANVADKVEQTLRGFGIPVYCENASDSFDSDELTQVVQHLRLMDNLTNDVALISELRGPLFELSESELCRVRLVRPQKEASFLEALRAASEQAPDERLRARCAGALEMLERERFLLSAMALDEYLWDFLQRSGLYAHYGAQPGGKLRQANLQMLCGMASDYEQKRGDGLRGFLDSLGTDLKVKGGLSPTVVNPWENVVRLMTIHKSKGLEFPTVYVMGLGGSLRRRSQSGKLAYHAELGVGLQYVSEVARTKRKTLLQSTIELARRGEDVAERARLLYVAMTRAKNRLCMLGSADLSDYGFDAACAMQQNGYVGGGVYAVKQAGSMLEWLAQSVRPWDEIEEKDFSTNPLLITDNKAWLSTLSTDFPQGECAWRVVFHIEPEVALASRAREQQQLELPPISALPERDEAAPLAWDGAGGPDPVAPPLHLAHHPLKLGVTALCRMLATGDEAEAGDADETETPRTKRMPYMPQLPKLLAALPQAPAFLSPAREEQPLLRGSATHKLLCMIDLAGARAAKDMAAYARQSAEELAQSGVLSAREVADADTGLVARFLSGDMGRRMLASDTVRREWRFNLRVSEPVETIAQGVIDLCFLEGGGWVLVDFKTDRVRDERELYVRYAQQLRYYRDALERATPYPVRECALFSLTLGKAVHESAH